MTLVAMERLDSNSYVLSTGRTLYANNGLIGLSVNRDGEDYRPSSACGFDIGEGYDGKIWARPVDDVNRNDEELTTEELIEVTEFMIEQWTTLKRLATERHAREQDSVLAGHVRPQHEQ